MNYGRQTGLRMAIITCVIAGVPAVAQAGNFTIVKNQIELQSNAEFDRGATPKEKGPFAMGDYVMVARNRGNAYELGLILAVLGDKVEVSFGSRFDHFQIPQSQIRDADRMAKGIVAQEQFAAFHGELKLRDNWPLKYALAYACAGDKRTEQGLAALDCSAKLEGPDQLVEALGKLTELDKLCTKYKGGPDFPSFTCSWTPDRQCIPRDNYPNNDFESNPKYMCSLASRRKALLAKAAEQLADELAKAPPRPAFLQVWTAQFNGWDAQSSGAAFSWKTYFQVTPERKKQFVEPFAALSKELGVPMPAEEKLLGVDVAENKVRAKVVEESAKQDLMPKQACGHYGCGMASNAVKEVYPNAKILKVGLGKDWVIEKNGFGIPTERWSEVVVMLQEPGEPYCQLRAVYINEPYKGKGKFQKASEAKVRALRFQVCK